MQSTTLPNLTAEANLFWSASRKRTEPFSVWLLCAAVSHSPGLCAEHAGRVSCLRLRFPRKAQDLGQASQWSGRVRHQSGLGSERFSSFKCVCQASVLRFFSYFFFFIFLIFPWGRGRKRAVVGMRCAALLVALCFVTWDNVCLIWEARPGHIPDVPSGSAALEGLQPGQWWH